MARNAAVLLVCGGLLLLPAARGFSSGLVSAACDSMTPSHSGAAPQSTPPPFSVTADGATYQDGDTITGKRRRHVELDVNIKCEAVIDGRRCSVASEHGIRSLLGIHVASQRGRWSGRAGLLQPDGWSRPPAHLQPSTGEATTILDEIDLFTI